VRSAGTGAVTRTLIFLGGLARLTQFEPGVVFGPELVVSSVVELVGMPALLIRLSALTRTSTRMTPELVQPAGA
jgi:hypothetical protein